MKKEKKELPPVSGHDVDQNLRKTEAILLRLTKADKKAIVDCAGSVHLTATEYLVKCHQIVSAKITK